MQKGVVCSCIGTQCTARGDVDQGKLKVKVYVQEFDFDLAEGMIENMQGTVFEHHVS